MNCTPDKLDSLVRAAAILVSDWLPYEKSEKLEERESAQRIIRQVSTALGGQIQLSEKTLLEELQEEVRRSIDVIEQTSKQTNEQKAFISGAKTVLDLISRKIISI